MFKIGDHKKVIDALNINYQRKPKMMTSAGAEHSLNVLLENNADEVKIFETFKDYTRKPRKASVTLHSYLEPANPRKIYLDTFKLSQIENNFDFKDFRWLACSSKILCSVIYHLIL